MKKHIQYTLFVSLLLLAGCNDDFLDRQPITEISKEKFFNNAEDLDTYIYSLYDFPGVGLYVGDASTDNSPTTSPTEIKSMMVGTPSAATILSGWEWKKLRDINFFLDNCKKAKVNEETLNHFEGLARFFRANFYMDKVKRYSDVPWYEHAMEVGDQALYKGRDSRALVIDKIFEDYEFAHKHIKNDQKRAGAVNKAVVLAYLSRHALYEGTYRKYHSELALQASAVKYLQIARDASKTILDSNKYALHGKYPELFNSMALEGNREVILGTFSEHEKRNSGWWAYMFGNYEASPARDLVQSYLMKDGSPYSSQAGYNTHLFVEEFKNRDPRLSYTLAYPGWELIHNSTYSQGVGIYVQQFAKNQSGYHQLKGFFNDKDISKSNSLDVPVIRLAEVLLTYAEAKAELGELSQADLDLSINKLRQRVGMPELTMSPVLDPVLKAQYPLVNGALATVLLEIRRERRVELAQEGFRFDDLMRWNAGKLLEKQPEGLYFPGLGKYDLTGDKVEDVKLIALSETIPEDKDKESNALGKKLVYYRVGPVGSDASFFLKNGTSGTIVTDPVRGTFQEPKFYYRPVPQTQVTLNPALTQIFGW